MVTPGNNYFFKRVIEVQILTYVLRRTLNDLQNLADALKTLSGQHRLVFTKLAMKNTKENIKALIASKGPSFKKFLNFESFFENIEELQKNLEFTQVSNSAKTKSESLWKFIGATSEDESIMTRLQRLVAFTRGCQQDNQPHQRGKCSLIRESSESFFRKNRSPIETSSESCP
jgi:hypothetical protein